MFKITDYSNKRTETVITNDINDAGDIILGITDSEEEKERAIRIMGTMHFDDIYGAKLFHITCVRG